MSSKKDLAALANVTTSVEYALCTKGFAAAVDVACAEFARLYPIVVETSDDIEETTLTMTVAPLAIDAATVAPKAA